MVPSDDWWLNALWSVTPTVLIGLIFWFIIRSIIRADRGERKAYARIEAEELERRARALGPAGSSDAGSSVDEAAPSEDNPS